MDTKKSTSIRFKDEDKRLIKWLRKRFGGSPQHAVVSMALKLLYDRERASQGPFEYPPDACFCLGSGSWHSKGITGCQFSKEGQARTKSDAAP